MVPLKPAALPSIALLPFADPLFVRLIDDVALLAGGLIASVDAAMMAIAVPSDRWDTDEPPLVVWNQRLNASSGLVRELTERPMFAPATDALWLAADALALRLAAWRWDHVDAPGLCLVTDGAGVVLFHRRPPVDADCGWLLDCAGSHGGGAIVRPPARGGIWSLILAEAGTLQ